MKSLLPAIALLVLPVVSFAADNGLATVKSSMDVTGHGLHASVVMSLVYGFIHRAALPLSSTLDWDHQFPEVWLK